MLINRDVILKLENLARLELTDADRQTLGHDLNNMLGMVQKLHELDTQGISPLVYLNEETRPTRADRIGAQLTTNQAIANAPDSDGAFFSVPKMK